MSRRARRVLALLGLGLAAGSGAAAGSACLDATPVTVSNEETIPDGAPPSADVQPGDGGTDREAEAAPSACDLCLHAPDTPGPGCADELAACQANPECGRAIACALGQGCFDMGSTAALVVCGLPCAAEAGIVTFTDPATTLAFNVFQCAGTTCATACNFATDGSPE